MKRIPLVILLALIDYNGFAQHKTSANLNQAPKIFRQPDLEKFYGTWVYEKNGQYFKIVLVKTIYSPSETIPSEWVSGTHTFKKNVQIIDQKRNSDTNYSINIGSIVRPNVNLISFRFKENNRPVMSMGTMEYIDGPTPMLKWKLNKNEYRRGIILPGQENLKDPEFIVPTDIILYKLK